jgi:hypothetical protein
VNKVDKEQNHIFFHHSRYMVTEIVVYGMNMTARTTNVIEQAYNKEIQLKFYKHRCTMERLEVGTNAQRIADACSTYLSRVHGSDWLTETTSPSASR